MSVFRPRLLLLSALAACQPAPQADPTTARPTFRPPVVTDTGAVARAPRRARWLETGNYAPLYVGPYQSRLRADHQLGQRYHDVGFGPGNGEAEPLPTRLRLPDSTRLQILVDTTQHLADYAQVWNAARQELTGAIFAAYPVFVVNRSNDTLLLGAGSHLRLQLEARDPQGRWRPIERPFSYMCGVGLRSIRLRPGQLALTTVPRPAGRYRTRLRLRLPWARHLGPAASPVSADFAAVDFL
jgi:hypothetical protein